LTLAPVDPGDDVYTAPGGFFTRKVLITWLTLEFRQCVIKVRIVLTFELSLEVSEKNIRD
jgi:hypothetical protein